MNTFVSLLFISYSTKEIDKQLGFFQQLFKLSGNQVRSLAVKEPRLITSKLDAIKVIILVFFYFSAKDFLIY